MTIIICCFNSKERLHLPLESIARQQLPADFQGRIVLVDNNSTDGTAERAKELWRTCGTSHWMLEVVNETKQGLTSARLRGISEASTDICMFLDDDVKMSETFIERALGLMAEHPQVAVLGGAVDPLFEKSPPPDWFWKSTGAFTVGNDGPKAKYSRSVAGAAMVFRRAAVDQLFARGFQFTLSDRCGSLLSGGGDIELCLAIQVVGWKVYYSPELTVKHWVSQKRLSREYALKVASGMGRSEVYLQPYRRALAIQEGGNSSWQAIKFCWSVQVVVRSVQASLAYVYAIWDLKRGKAVSAQLVRAAKQAQLVKELFVVRGQYPRLFKRVQWLQECCESSANG
jgi:GT2 family glycosyltransferase